MGTTFVVAVIYGRSVYVANIGDSRLYLADRELKQVTRDHSYVEEMVQMGTLNREDARTNEYINREPDLRKNIQSGLHSR